MNNDQNYLLKVFLCHASSDKPAVQQLYSRLSNDGVDAWLDKEKLIPGQNWQMEISKAVRNSDIVLVCLSSQSVNKDGFVQKEIRFALDAADEKPEGTIFIIPTRLENCNVPERISQFHWVDLYEKDGYERLLKALLVRAATLGKKIKPPTRNVNSAQRKEKKSIAPPQLSEKKAEIKNKPKSNDKTQERVKTEKGIDETENVILEKIEKLEYQKDNFQQSMPNSKLIVISILPSLLFSILVFYIASLNFPSDIYNASDFRVILFFASLLPPAFIYMTVYNKGKLKDKLTLEHINKEIEELKNKLQS